MSFIRHATLFAFGVILLVGNASAAPEAKRWKLWETHNPASSLQVDHSAWDRFLATYVVTDHPSGIHRVRYDEVMPKDRRELKKYLDHLEKIYVPNLNRAEQRAYWINFYNALTVDLVLDHPDVEKITQIDTGLFRFGPWPLKRVSVVGTSLSLNDIEHRILRPIWRDARLHYVLNCGGLGCPNLPSEAFTAENTERLLTEAARAYVNHPRGASVKKGKLTVASLYFLYRDDFGGTDRNVVSHLRRYASEALMRQLASVDSISDHGYDWRLNKP
jgi:hypothetical protein